MDLRGRPEAGSLHIGRTNIRPHQHIWLKLLGPRLIAPLATLQRGVVGFMYFEASDQAETRTMHGCADGT